VTNTRAIKRAESQREAIRRAWLGLTRVAPFERVTARRLAELLPFRIGRSTLSRHMADIRLEALLAELSVSEQRSDDQPGLMAPQPIDLPPQLQAATK
jgi:hypothetical protein